MKRARPGQNPGPGIKTERPGRETENPGNHSQADQPKIAVDGGRMMQVFVNLIMNGD
jgi:signal transduction histidine kinase